MKISEDLIQEVHRGGAQQHLPELRFMCAMLEKVQPKKILEIGTGIGTFTYILQLYGTVVSMDVREGMGAGFAPLCERHGTRSRAAIICADSHLEETAEKVRADYDLVIIDGDHSWEGGFRDWELYSGMAPVVAIHDIGWYEHKHGIADCGHAWDWFPTEFWWEIKNGKGRRGIELPYKFRTEECVVEKSGGWGVIYKI